MTNQRRLIFWLCWRWPNRSDPKHHCRAARFARATHRIEMPVDSEFGFKYFIFFGIMLNLLWEFQKYWVSHLIYLITNLTLKTPKTISCRPKYSPVAYPGCLPSFALSCYYYFEKISALLQKWRSRFAPCIRFGRCSRRRWARNRAFDGQCFGWNWVFTIQWASAIWSCHDTWVVFVRNWAFRIRIL